MINLVLILTGLDIVAMAVLIVAHRIPPLRRRVGDIPLVRRHWPASWGHPSSIVPLLLLVLTALFVALTYLLETL